MNLPKVIPHNPVSTTKKNITIILPLIVKWKTANVKTKTEMVCSTMSTNCVIKWPNNISCPVIPSTKLLSKSPSFLSTNIDIDVDATDKKKMTLSGRKIKKKDLLLINIIER